MKKLVAIFVGLVTLGLVAGKALASEGVVKLKPVNGFTGQCFAVSVYQDGMYRILATCKDLVVAYSPEGSYYVLWATTKDNKTYRLGEIQRGKIQTAVDQPFNGLFVTVESDSYPRKASDQKVLEGGVEGIPYFATEMSGGNVVNLTVQPTIAPSVTPTPAPLIPAKKTSVQTEWSFGKVMGIIGRLIGITILILIVAGVVLTIVTRRKEQ